MAPAAKKTSKPIFKTEIPFTATQWPSIGQKHQEVILDLLCSLLEPLGHHRQSHTHPSKGKKRKRGPRHPPHTDPPTVPPTTEPIDTSPPPPPPPELSSHLLIGLNSITRHLTLLAEKNAPSNMPASAAVSSTHDQEKPSTKIEEVQESKEPPTNKPKSPTQNTQNNPNHNQSPEEPDRSNTEVDTAKPLSLLIIPHPTPSASLPHAHLPTLVYLSTAKHSPPTRLICLPSVSETKLAAALHIPRVGALGITEDAPGVGPLLEYARQNVGPVKCLWVEEAMRAEWQGVKTSMQMS